MRFLILKDTKITDAKLDELRKEFTDLVKGATGLSPVFFVDERDYTQVPTEMDGDGDLKPTKAYLTALTADVYKKYGTYGVDSVVMLVHQDNWVFDGIWGSNFSNIYFKTWYTTNSIISNCKERSDTTSSNSASGSCTRGSRKS